MSLLMDALKKAEEAKRQSEAAAKLPPQEAGTAAPGPADDRAKQGLPELPARLELLDEEFHTGAPAPGTAPARPAPQAEAAQQKERAAAQNLFEAKQPARRGAFPIVIGALTLIAAAGIGGYFWWQLQPKGGLAAAPGGAPLPRPAPIAPPPAAPGIGEAASPAPAQPAPAAAAPAPERTVAAAPREPAPPPRARGGQVTEPDSPIRISTGRLQANPVVARAYQALLAGDLAAARRDYEQVLSGEAKNTDALHGLAAIALRAGRIGEAEDLYLRILEADPKDAAAQAGLIGLKGQADPVQSESRLKTLLAGQPDSPSLNFTLGNLYARQGRWNEAQQAYFRAYSGDSDNPDYQFNLAISLEQLRQSRLALQYYQGALAASAHRPAAFDRSVVAGRVRELQQ